jgi:hypothetical protein
MAFEHSTSQLREHSLVGAQLHSACLAGSDLRGTDFTGADLHDADLSHIRSGMSRRWTELVVTAALVFSICIGFVAGICARYLREMYASDELNVRAAAWFVTAMMLVFIVVGILKGLMYATRTVLPVAAALAVTVGVVAVLTGMGTGRASLLAAVFLALVVLVLALSVLARAVAATAGTVFFAVVAIAGGLAAAAEGGGLPAAAIAIGAMLMARRSAKPTADYPLLERMIATIASRGGTCFRNANLAGANLADARLVACDFRGADLTGARFDHATILACRIDGTAPPFAGAAGGRQVPAVDRAAPNAAETPSA